MHVKRLQPEDRLYILDQTLSGLDYEYSSYIDFLKKDGIPFHVKSSEVCQGALLDERNEKECWAIWYFPVLELHVKFIGSYVGEFIQYKSIEIYRSHKFEFLSDSQAQGLLF